MSYELLHSEDIVDSDIIEIGVILAVEHDAGQTRFPDLSDDLVFLVGVLDRIYHQQDAVEALEVSEVEDIILADIVALAGDDAAEGAEAGDIGGIILCAGDDTVYYAVLIFLVDTGDDQSELFDPIQYSRLPFC